MQTAKILFILTLFIILWPYTIYPLILSVNSLFKKLNLKKDPQYLPLVSVIIAAHNEEASIREKINNTLSLNYPKDKLEIIVASDYSTDKTIEIVKSFQNSQISVVEITQRKGKTFAQNKAIEKAQGEIVLFSDATTIYDKNSLKTLIENFADSKVGCVGGNLIYVENTNDINTGSKRYWDMEKLIKRLESKTGFLFGLSGCMYAARKELCQELKPNIMEDLGRPLVIASLGYINLFEPKALCWEKVNTSYKSEINMRQRVIARTIHTFFQLKALLNPFKYPKIFFAVISHKIIRYLYPLLFTLLLIISALNINEIYAQITMVCFIYSVICFLTLKSLPEQKLKFPLFITMSYYLILTNVSILRALGDIFKKNNTTYWQPTR